MDSRDTGTQHKLRMPPELKQKIQESAKAYNRSMNADIVARLERSFLTEPEFSPLNMPPEELKRRLQVIADNPTTEPTELHIEVSPYSEQIDELKQQLSDHRKLMEVQIGFFESMLNGNQEEFLESVFTKYPNFKPKYEEAYQNAKNKTKNDPK